MPVPETLTPSVCVDAVFEDVPIEVAIATVARLGYSAFEFWAWWEKDLQQLNQLREEHELTVAACCTRFISLTDSSLRDEYIGGVVDSIEAAKELQCRTLISQVGDLLSGCDRKRQHQSIVDGLKAVAPRLEDNGITLVIEPLNEKVNHPGYFLIRSDEAFEIVDEVGSDNVKVVFDIYHQQISEGNLIPNITDSIEKIGHFHAAGQPGRNELSRGEINYPEIFESIRQLGYHQYVGLEYWPLDDPEVGLAEVSNWFGQNAGT